MGIQTDLPFWDQPETPLVVMPSLSTARTQR
jgi:hypothetical protein